MLEDMRALGLALTLCGPPIVFAQYEPVRELLTPVDAQKRADLANRYAVEIAEWEYFAKPGTLGIYEFDLAVLDSPGRISITPAGSEPIEFVSHGLERNPRWGGSLMVWHGELISESTKRGSPVELNVAVQSIDEMGNTRLPDPNREVTLQALQEESYTVLKESYDRRNERLVYSLAGNFLTVPDRKATYAFQLLDDQFSAVVFYEIDRRKTFSLPDVVVTEAGIQSEESEVDPEQMRRLKAYEAHMERVRRALPFSRSGSDRHATGSVGQALSRFASAYVGSSTLGSAPLPVWVAAINRPANAGRNPSRDVDRRYSVAGGSRALQEVLNLPVAVELHQS